MIINRLWAGVAAGIVVVNHPAAEVGARRQDCQQEREQDRENYASLSMPTGRGPYDEGAVMTVREVADYLHCHHSTVHRMVEHGELPGFKLGGD